MFDAGRLRSVEDVKVVGSIVSEGSPRAKDALSVSAQYQPPSPPFKLLLEPQ